MAIYIALLRGINVGGKNKIKMADLKTAFESAGFTKVQTYIQSGNVLFESDEEEQALAKKITLVIHSSLGLSVPVVLRTVAELKQFIENCPFTESEIREAETQANAESLYAAFLNNAPVPGNAALLDKYAGTDDRYLICGRNIYLLFRHSIRESKLAARLDSLDAVSTVRNFKTISKLVELSAQME